VARVLRKISVDEISSVSRGANPKALVSFWKRDGVAKSLFGDVMQDIHDRGLRVADRARAPLEKLVRETIEGCGRDPFGMPGDPLSVRSIADKVVAMTKRGGAMLPITTEERDLTPAQAAWLAGNSPRAAGEGYEAYLRRIQGPMAVVKGALDSAVKSIIDDAGAINKAAMITESVVQFVEYLEKRGVDPDEAEQAAGEVVAKYALVKHEEAKVGPETVFQKVDRAVSFGKSLQQTIDDYAKEHNCSLSKAADKIILGGGIDLSLSGPLGGPVNEYARMEKSLRSAEDSEYGMALGARGDHGVVVREATIIKGDKGKYGAKLAEMSREFHNSEWGKGMTAAQAFDHVSTRTDKGRKLFAKDKAERMGQPVEDDGEDVAKDYNPSDARSLDGNRSLSGNVLSVFDAVEIMRRMLADKMRLDPSTNAIQYVNSLARSPQWSREIGRAAAARVMEQARQAGGGYADGYAGPSRGNIDKRTAMDQLQEIAKRLRAADPSLTEAQAFVKIYENPANRDLVRKEFAQRMAGKAA
jgi:hypothetical protein